jgi:hypothetical protein
MVAFVSANIPTNITSVEQLHAWSGFLLSQYFGNQSIKEVANGINQSVCESFYIPTPNDGERLIFRASLRLDPNFRVDTSKKMFRQVLDLGLISGGIPASYTT